MVVGAGQQTSTTEVSSSAHQQTGDDGDDGGDDADALAQMAMIKAGYYGSTDTSAQHWYQPMYTWLTGIIVLADKVAFPNASGRC